jgi:hypothetical protein
MHCDKCGKENRENSKFCRSCGISLAEEITDPIVERKSIKEFKIDWKNPVVFLIIGLIVTLGLFWGATNVYGYFKVSSKINKAEKLLENKNYVGSLDILNTLEFGSGTDNQKLTISRLKEDNKKFSDYKTLFDTITAKIGATSTVTDLKQAQTDLQSIDSAYPDYESVKTKLNEISGLLMTALENDSAANKALAEKNRQAAAAAQAAKDRAEANAQSAISGANALADQAREEEVLKSYENQLLVIRNDFNKGVDNYIAYLKAYNDRDYSLAAVYSGAIVNICYSTHSNSKDLRETFTGMPTNYNNASINLEWAGYYLCESLDSWVDEDYDSAKTESDKMFNYSNKVDDFLNI